MEGDPAPSVMDSALALLDLDYLQSATEPSSSSSTAAPVALHSSSSSPPPSPPPPPAAATTMPSGSSAPPSPVPALPSLHTTPTASPLLPLSSSFDLQPHLHLHPPQASLFHSHPPSASISSSSFSSFPSSSSSFPSSSSSIPSTSSALQAAYPVPPQLDQPMEDLPPPPPLPTHLPAAEPMANPSSSNSSAQAAPIPEASLDEIPVFYPTMEEFRDFSKFVTSIEPRCRVGLAKVVPPKEWFARRNYENLPNFLIQSPIVQHFFGSAGVFKQLNIERKSLRIGEFERLATEMDQSKMTRGRRDRVRNGEAEGGADEEPLGKIQLNEGRPGRGKKRKAPTDTAVTTAELDSTAAPSTSADPITLSPNAAAQSAASIPAPQDSDPKQGMAEASESQPEGLSQTPTQKEETPGPGQPEGMKAKKKSGYPKGDEFFTYRRKEQPARTKEAREEEYADLERLYWKSISFSNPMYGADMQGSLFDKDVDAWNVTRLGCLLDKLPEKLPGVNLPYLYIGMWKATFSWHVEDMDLFSINYIHFGAPKTWYVVPIPFRRKFEAFAQSLFPEEKRTCPEFLRHKTCLINPQILLKHGIPVRRIFHEEGEFMITFPGAYHAGFNNGFNCAESINFALESWIEVGKAAASCNCQGDSVRINMKIFTGEPESDESESDSDDDEQEIDPGGPGDVNNQKASLSPKNGKVKKETKKDQREKKGAMTQEQREERRKEKAARREARLQKKAQKEETAKAAAQTKKIKKRIIPQEFMGFNEPGFCNICLAAVDDAAKLTCCECEFTCHRDCYGFVSEETRAQSFNPDWKCIKCFRNSHRMGCIFCPMYGGCFKMTETLQWGHVSCGMWIPEVSFADDTLNEYIVGIDNIPSRRWSLKCSICKIQHGACIQCTTGACTQSFHVTCAQKKGLYMSMVNPETNESEFRVCCPAHDPRKKLAKGPPVFDPSIYEVGKEVWGRWSGGFYYCGTIAAVYPTPDGKDASILVNFKDGASKSMKPKDLSFTRPKKALDDVVEPAAPAAVLFPIEASIEGLSTKRQRKSVDYKALNG